VKTHAEPQSLQAELQERRQAGARIGFVPTMGFLHPGHRSLMALARPLCDHLVVSIYVNPLQFGPGEDIESYPRDPEGDAAACRAEGVDTLFIPSDLYTDGHTTTVSVSGLSEGLCGADRPGHFDGVTTVVSRLFGLVQPQIAVFGEKDYQQLAVIRQMVRDLALPVQVLGGPLVRDSDGLALSSRNAYLSPPDRSRALSLSAALQAMVSSNLPSAAERLSLGRGLLQADSVDYLTIVDAQTLQPLQRIDRPGRALVAARIRGTRLIDNMALN
jgi:pantoate--beta-alanine ligase